MDYCSIGGGSSSDENIEMLELLKKYVPHIHWELCWGDHDVGVSGVKSYSYIGVPDYQLDEAVYVIGLMEEGEDLSDYRSESRFPELFEEDDGEFHVLKSIISFAENVQELINMLECIPLYDLAVYLENLSKLMSSIYTLQYDLPECNGNSYYQTSSSISLHPGLKPFLIYHDNSDPFKRTQDDQYLEETLEDILNSLQIGFMHYDRYLETGDYKQLSIAVNEWKNGSSEAYGWGTGIVNAQRVIHYARVYLTQGKLPEPDNKIGPEEYLFALCTFVISGVEDYEKILADYNMVRFHQDLSEFARSFVEIKISHYQEWFNTINSDIWDSVIETYDISKDETVLITQLLSIGEREKVQDKLIEEWPVEQFPNGFIWDSLWIIIDNRIKEAEVRIRKGEGSLYAIMGWVDLYNTVMEYVLDTVGEDSSINIHLGDANKFPSYFVDNLLERIDWYNAKGYDYPLIPFREVILALRRTINKPEWPQNEIQFGRFLEWVRIFATVIAEKD